MKQYSIVVKGRVVRGLGEGARYVELYRENIRRYLGINPYPGTLNIDLGKDATELFREIYGKIVPPPHDGYAPIIAYRAEFRGEKVYVIRPCITRHGWNILEVIAEEYLRKKYGLRDGDEVEIVIYKFF